MRRVISWTTAAGMAAGIVALPTSLATAALVHDRSAPNRTLASYCNRTHYICLRIVDHGGTVSFNASFVHHFARYYRLCVKASGSGAAGLRRCGPYPLLRRASGSWGSSVNYDRNYPMGEPGWVRVTWSDGSRPLGPTLRFKLPLSR
jgi:hypothetical protein